MSNVSRWNLTADPETSLVAAALQMPLEDREQVASSLDPLLTNVAVWLATKQEIEAMEQAWRDAEHQLSMKAREMKLDLLAATQGDMPEARSMRTLMRRIKAAERKLDCMSSRISETRATVAEAALAKIELGLRVQGPYDWQANVLALLKGGVEDLRALVRAGSLSPRSQAD